MNKLLEIISKNNDFTTAQLAAMLNESEKDVARQLKDPKGVDGFIGPTTQNGGRGAGYLGPTSFWCEELWRDD